MSEIKDWQEILENAKCPDSFGSGGTGPLIAQITDVNSFAENIFTYYPGDSNVESLSRFNDPKNGTIEVHSHGVWIRINDNYFLIRNERIVLIDTIPFDEYVTVKKKMSDYMLTGALLAGGGIAGSVIGAAVGALFGIGNKKIHNKGFFLRVFYWDDEKQLRYIILANKGKKEDIDGLIKIWEEQKKINEETGRKPEDVKGKGCLGIIVLFVISSIALAFL